MENVINTPIPEFNQSESALQTKPKTNFLNIILISFAFILFSTGVYFLGKQSVKPSINTPVAVLPQTTPVPTVTTDPTTTWKIYTDAKNRFSFSYPSTMEIKTNDGRLSMYINNFDYPLSIIPDGPHNWGEGLTKVQLDKIYMKSFQYPDIPSKNMYPDTSVQFVIEFMTQEDKNNSVSVLQKIDQILSTFKFTESKDNLSTLQNKLNQYLSANLLFTSESEGKTIDLSDYYNPEFAKYGNKTDLIKKALIDSGFVYDKSLDKTIITTWTSTYKSSTNTCVLSGSEENLSLICN